MKTKRNHWIKLDHFIITTYSDQNIDYQNFKVLSGILRTSSLYLQNITGYQKVWFISINREENSLINVSLDKGGSVGSIASSTASVQTLASKTVGSSSLKENCLCSGDVGVLTLPGLKTGLLEGTAI